MAAQPKTRAGQTAPPGISTHFPGELSGIVIIVVVVVVDSLFFRRHLSSFPSKGLWLLQRCGAPVVVKSPFLPLLCFGSGSELGDEETGGGVML